MCTPDTRVLQPLLVLPLFYNFGSIRGLLFAAYMLYLCFCEKTKRGETIEAGDQSGDQRDSFIARRPHHQFIIFIQSFLVRQLLLVTST